MSESVLLDFLSAGLINVGGDDSKLEKIQDTASDLALLLKKTPAKTIPFALVSFDPNVPETDPVIIEVATALKKRWTTYSNTFSSAPIIIFRAILLESIISAASDDDNVAFAFVAFARNLLPFVEAGHESKIWATVVSDVERRVNIRAESEWATPDAIKLPALNVGEIEPVNVVLTRSKVDEDSLKKAIEASAGPSNRANQPTGGNPYWTNSNQSWSYEFSDRLTSAIATSLNKAILSVQASDVDLRGSIGAFVDSVSEYVGKSLAEVTNATKGLQRRTQLIWWKEALYSPSAQCSYRDLSPEVAATLMAFDLHQQVPVFSPASVMAFLYEAIETLPKGSSSPEFSLGQIVDAIKKSDELASFRQKAESYCSISGETGPVLVFLGNGIPTAPSPELFKARTGIVLEQKMSVSQWAVWIFRELQALKALQKKSVAKNKSQ